MRKAPGELSGVLFSHGLIRSTFGDGALNFRVRNGAGCTRPSMATELARGLAASQSTLKAAQRADSRVLSRDAKTAKVEEELDQLVPLA